MKLVILLLFVLALTASATENSWVQCAKDAVVLAEDVAKLVKDAEQKQMAVIIKDLEAILKDIQALKTDCGIKLQVQPINGWEDCTKDILVISQLALDIKDDITHFNIVKLAQDVDALYAEVQKAIKDCGAGEQLNTDWIQCAKDAVQLAADVKQLVADAQAQKMAQVIQDLQTLLSDINSLKKDCGISLAEVMMNEGDWAQCLQDIAQIASLASSITDDIKHFNIIKLAKDVNALYQTVQQALKDCTGQMETYNTNWLKCGQAVYVLIQKVDHLLKDYKDKQQVQVLIADLKDIYAQILVVSSECNIPLKFIITPSVGTWEQCLKDIEIIGQLAVSIKADITHFNIGQLAKDVEALYQEVQQALQDCK